MLILSEKEGNANVLKYDSLLPIISMHLFFSQINTPEILCVWLFISLICWRAGNKFGGIWFPSNPISYLPGGPIKTEQSIQSI